MRIATIAPLALFTLLTLRPVHAQNAPPSPAAPAPPPVPETPAPVVELEDPEPSQGHFVALGLPKVPDSIRLGSGAPPRCRVAVELPEEEELTTTRQILDASKDSTV